MKTSLLTAQLNFRGRGTGSWARHFRMLFLQDTASRWRYGGRYMDECICSHTDVLVSVVRLVNSKTIVSWLFALVPHIHSKLSIRRVYMACFHYQDGNMIVVLCLCVITAKCCVCCECRCFVRSPSGVDTARAVDAVDAVVAVMVAVRCFAVWWMARTLSLGRLLSSCSKFYALSTEAYEYRPLFMQTI